jgi:threonine/homoserine efflux transporter RhtA
MVAAVLIGMPVASKQAGPAPIGISLLIFGILLAILLAILLGHVADHASRRYEYARFGAGPVTTCGPAHFASDD